MQAKVYIAIPNLGKIRTDLVFWLINTLKTHGHLVGYIDLPIDRPVENNRNKIAFNFLKSDCTHLLTLDNDLALPDDQLPHMLSFDKDIVGGAVLIWHPVLKCPIHFAFTGEHKNYEFVDIKNNNLQPCSFVGSGIMMIKRRVFEIIKPPFFLQMLDEKGIFEGGEDEYFCIKAKKAKLGLYVDCSRILDQEKNLSLMEINNFANKILADKSKNK